MAPSPASGCRNSRSSRQQTSFAVMAVSEISKKYWSFGNILGQGGFGLIYLAIILPMYVLLKLVELGPGDVTFIIGSVTVVYFVLSSMLSIWYSQVRFHRLTARDTLLSSSPAVSV